MVKRALVCGITGQDGSYLAQLLLSRGYEVWGTSRDAQVSSRSNLRRLGIEREVRLESMALTDFRSVLQGLVRAAPDEVYNLAGQSSVGLSFDQPVETLESVTLGTLNLLEAVRFSGLGSRVYNAASSECFGDAADGPATETTPFRPRSPYAVAKAAAFWTVANYRDAYSLHACSGILFNHESPLRPERFVTQKIVRGACRIAEGSGERLKLGTLTVRRDWGWAPEYVEAMHRMLQVETPQDFVIATGESHSLEDFTRLAFEVVGLDWREHVDLDPALQRPSEIEAGLADPSKASRLLGWRADVRMPEVVRRMVVAALENRAGDSSPS